MTQKNSPAPRRWPLVLRNLAIGTLLAVAVLLIGSFLAMPEAQAQGTQAR